MPYIVKERRELLDKHFDKPDTEGELNYVITMSVRAYLRRKGMSYATMNAIVGVLEQVKDEFQRIVIHPYEDGKSAENGEVY